MVDVSPLTHSSALHCRNACPTDDNRHEHGRRGDRNRRPQHEERRQSQSYQGVPTGPRADREKGGPNGSASVNSSMPPPSAPGSSNGSHTPLTSDSADYVPPMTDDDLSAIRSRYLGVDKKKRKIRKMNDRKFVFDWDEQDDTFSNEAPAAVGSQRQGAQVMFGRGHIAGMDDGGNGPVPGRKTTTDGGFQLADSLERRRAAKTGIDERHWTEKSLEEMKERDWRIFREDFSIAARGTLGLSSRLMNQTKALRP